MDARPPLVGARRAAALFARPWTAGVFRMDAQGEMAMVTSIVYFILRHRAKKAGRAWRDAFAPTGSAPPEISGGIA